MTYIDTHAHLDGEEFANDLDDTIFRAKQAGAEAVLIPAIDLKSSIAARQLSLSHPAYCYPMIGLHPEEVRPDYADIITQMKQLQAKEAESDCPYIAIGEVGLDFYWSREYEKEQLAAFETQVVWAIETGLPLMIHCRKAQNEMVAILRRYKNDLPGGVFHCFTGNAIEAGELLQFHNFVLGIGGVSTFKKSHLPEVLPEAVPLERVVLETDSPYMAPVPLRGQRNEPSFIPHIISRLADAYQVTEQQLCNQTTLNAKRLFKLC